MMDSSSDPATMLPVLVRKGNLLTIQPWIQPSRTCKKLLIELWPWKCLSCWHGLWSDTSVAFHTTRNRWLNRWTVVSTILLYIKSIFGLKDTCLLNSDWRHDEAFSLVHNLRRMFKPQIHIVRDHKFITFKCAYMYQTRIKLTSNRLFESVSILWQKSGQVLINPVWFCRIHYRISFDLVSFVRSIKDDNYDDN